MARYPLEFGWHTDAYSDDDTPAAPAFTPMLPTLLSGADPATLGLQSPIHLAQAGGPVKNSNDDNDLKFETKYPDPPGNPNQTNGWRGHWLVTKPSSTGGYIVQKVIHTLPGGKAYTYWEAWEVKPGQDRTVRYNDSGGTEPDDTFRAVRTMSRGTHRIEAEARFYPGLQLPPTFKKYNVPEPGELHSTETRPDFWEDSSPRSVTRPWEVDPG